jgi:hypothetical protein
LLGAALLVLALIVPASAMAGHDLRMYKVEQHLDLDNDEQALDVSCQPGDYVLDGMWRIDNVDQDNEYGDNELKSVDVYESYGDAADKSKWHFRFVKNAAGRAQLKMFLTCLDSKTVGGGPSHDFILSGQHSKAKDYGSPAASDDTSGGNCTSAISSFSPGSIVVAPGFRITDDDHFARIFGSIHNNTNLRSWKWGFAVDSLNEPGKVEVSWRCLNIKTSLPSSGPNHRHRIVYKLKTSTVTIPANNSPTERKLVCGEHYKGVVAGWWTNDPFDVYYLGMDPRIKARAFKFVNTGGFDRDVDLALICFNDRTT